MNLTQQKIRQILQRQREHSRAVALMTALSVLLLCVAPFVGLLPGIAFTGTGANGGTYSVDDAGEFFDAPAYDYPAGAANMAQFLNGVTSSVDFDNNGEGYNAGSNPSVGFELKLNFALTNSQLESTQLLTGVPYLYYQLDTIPIRPNNNIFGSSSASRVEDKTANHMTYGSKTSLAGYFSSA